MRLGRYPLLVIDEVGNTSPSNPRLADRPGLHGSLAVIIAGVIIILFQPSFAAILAVAILPLLCYPYWRDVRAFRAGGTGRAGTCSSRRQWPVPPFSSRPPSPFPARSAAPTRQRRRAGGRTTPSTPLCSRWPECWPPAGTRLGNLATLCSTVWLYIGLMASLVLPHHTGSWGRVDGALAVLVGAAFAVITWQRAHDTTSAAK
jgi:hypothetical protein